MANRKINKLNKKAFEKARDQIEDAFPQKNISKGFYITSPSSDIFNGIEKVSKSVHGKIVNNNVNLRVYREPTLATGNILYKVDEYHGVNQTTIIKPRGSEIENHYIAHDIPTDIMLNTNISIELISDGGGGLQPNTRPDGTVTAYVNFIDPRENLPNNPI